MSLMEEPCVIGARKAFPNGSWMARITMSYRLPKNLWGLVQHIMGPCPIPNSIPKPIPWPAHIKLTHQQRYDLMRRRSMWIDFDAQICLAHDHGYVEFWSPKDRKPLLVLGFGKAQWG